MSDYFADTSAVSASSIKCFLKSRREYEAQYVTCTMERDETDSMRLGSLAHAMLLEPQALERFIVPPPSVLNKDGHRKGKAWSDFEEHHTAVGRTIVTPKQWADAEAMIASVRARCGAWFENVGEPEQPIYWDCPDTGLRCKAKPDYLVRTPSNVICLDLKTAADVTPSGFRSAVLRLRYYIQACHYRDGLRAIYGGEPKFLFVAVQSSPPYQCRVYDLPEDEDCPMYRSVSYKRAALDIDDAKDGLLKCREANDYSDIGENDIVTLHWEDCS